MQRKTVFASMAALFVFALTASPSWAQRAGFQVGLAQPPSAFAAPQTRATAAGSMFTAAPGFAAAFSQAIGGPVTPVVSLVPTFPTVIVANQVFVPGQTAFQAPVVNTTPVTLPARPGWPATGTPRSDVVRQVGPPYVTVVTRTGET